MVACPAKSGPGVALLSQQKEGVLSRAGVVGVVLLPGTREWQAKGHVLQAGEQPVRWLAVMGECYMWAPGAKEEDVHYKSHLQYLEADEKLAFQSLLQMQGTN